MNVHPSLRVEFGKDFTRVNNSEFVAGTALIAYTDKNRNNSNISKEAFEDAMPSLGLIPIVGHWLPEKNNFGGHDITMEWSGNELILKDNTIPYGVVRENHNAEWVEIEENGVLHNYLKADVVLWYGRYQSQIQKIIDTGVNQSMEINPIDLKQENNLYNIKKFEYSALCLLGKEVDEYGNKGEDNVEPCFESASVVAHTYAMSEDFRKQLDGLLFEYNNQTSNFIKKEDIGTGEKLDIDISKESADFETDWANVDKTSLRNDILTAKNYKTLVKKAYLAVLDGWEESPSSNLKYPVCMIKDNTLVLSANGCQSALSRLEQNKDAEYYESAKKKLKKYYQILDLDSTNFSVGENFKEEDCNLSNVEKTLTFSATYKQKREAICNALDPIIVRDEEDNLVSETYYWLDDFDDEYCMVEKNVWERDGEYDCSYGRFAYTFDESEIKVEIVGEFEKLIKTALTEDEYEKIVAERDSAVAMAEEFEVVKKEIKDYKEAVAKHDAEISEYSAKLSVLQKYQDEVEAERKQIMVEEILSDFEAVLSGNEEFEAVKETAMEYEDLEVLQKELFALEGKVRHEKTVAKPKKTAFASKVSVADTNNTGYYGNSAKYIK